jgi:adenylate cyclase class 2
MPIEAELKARVRDSTALLAALDARAVGESAVYRDHYFDSRDGSFAAAGHELRIRTVETRDSTRHILTYKAPAVDQASGSKPEHETKIADPDATAAIVHGLGYRTQIAFTKHCRNYCLCDQERNLLATVVNVPEIDGTFIELETIVQSQEDLPAALDIVRAVLTSLGISETDLTDELYTEAVAKALAPTAKDGNDLAR